MQKILGSGSNDDNARPWVCFHGAGWQQGADVAYTVKIEGAAPDAVMQWKSGDQKRGADHHIDTTLNRTLSSTGGWNDKNEPLDEGFQLPGANLGIVRMTVQREGKSHQKLKYDPTLSPDDSGDKNKGTSTSRISKAEDEIEKNPDVLRAIRRAWPACDPVQALDYTIAALNDQALIWANTKFSEPTDALNLNLFLPTTGYTQSPPQLLWVDANHGNNVEHDLAPLAGQTMRVWAFNLAPSQSLAVVQGPRADSAELGVLVAYGLSAGVGATIGITPTTPAASPSSSPAANPSTSADGCDAKCSPSPCTVTCQSSKDPAVAAIPPPLSGKPPATCERAPEMLGAYVASLVNQKLAAPKQNFQTAVAFPSVTGDYNYIAEILDPTFGQAPQKGATNAAAGDSAPSVPSKGTAVAVTTPIVASESFRSYSPHRIVSVGIEEAWSARGKYSTGGYAYLPVAQSGADQIYQLQGVPTVSNQLTFSALLLFYPGPVLGPATRHRFWDGFLLGFGPSLVRGGTAELFRQWNLRLGYEFNDVALTLGASFRNLDVPSSAAPDSLVSVPKPPTTPSFATTDGWEPLFSVGLAADLDIITAGVNAIAAAAKGGK